MTPTLQVTVSTESFAWSLATEHLKPSAKSSDIYAGSSLGRPYSPLSVSTNLNSKGPEGTEGKAVSIIRGKVDEFAGEYKLSGKSTDVELCALANL